MASTLDKIYLLLVRYLNVGSVKPHLKQKGLLTDEEFERLDSVCHQTTQSAVETLVKIIKRKGPNHEVGFLSALKDSMEFDPHQGHVEIIAALEKSLTLAAVNTVIVEEDQDVMETDFINQQAKSSSIIETESHKKAAVRSKVVKATSDIRHKFARLVLDVYRLLSKLKVSVEEIRLGLLYLGCFKDKTDGNIEQYPVVSPTSDLSHTETVQSLLACLHCYSSWYNYGLIKFIATEFGGEEGALIIDEYIKSLTLYCEKIVACQCPEFSLADGLPPGYDQLIVKVDWDHLSRTAQDIAIFQAELSTLLNLEPEVFILKGVEEGCVLLTWAVPQAITTYIVMESMKCHQQLTKLNILSIITAGKFIDVKKPHAKEEKYNVRQSSSPQPRSSDTTSQYSVLSDYTPLDTPVTIQSGFNISTMTADELEIISTYSGRSRSSMYSTDPQIFNGATDFAKAYSESNILSQVPPYVRALRRNSLPAEDTITKMQSKGQQAKRIFKSLLPRICKRKTSSNKSVLDPRNKTPSDFPILNLSMEPVMKMEGERVYSHYYCDGDPSSLQLTPSQACGPVASVNLHTAATEGPSADPPKLTDLRSHVEDHACADSISDHINYSSRSDTELGLGSQNLPNTSSTYDLQLGTKDYSSSVQRSQSMKYPSSIPYNDRRRHSYQKQTSSHPSYERVDTPSSGYCGSHSGCCSMQSLSSAYCNTALDGTPAGYDHPENTPYYGCSSLKRSSITTGIKPKVCKKSARSYSFNDKYTIYRDSTQ